MNIQYEYIIRVYRRGSCANNNMLPIHRLFFFKYGAYVKVFMIYSYLIKFEGGNDECSNK